jgi:hypothetical protein
MGGGNPQSAKLTAPFIRGLGLRMEKPWAGPKIVSVVGPDAYIGPFARWGTATGWRASRPTLP